MEVRPARCGRQGAAGKAHIFGIDTPPNLAGRLTSEELRFFLFFDFYFGFDFEFVGFGEF